MTIKIIKVITKKSRVTFIVINDNLKSIYSHNLLIVISEKTK